MHQKIFTLLICIFCIIPFLKGETDVVHTSMGAEAKEVIFLTGSNVFSFSSEELTVGGITNYDTDAVFLLVDEYPVFEHGEGLRSFVESRLEYPESAIDNHVEGVVLVSFIVEKDGRLSSPRVVRGIGYGCEEEVIKVLAEFPRMRPGFLSGEPVRVALTLPVRFQLKY